MPFTPDDLELLASAREVQIETHSGQRAIRTVIWIAVDDHQVFVRSVRGDDGRWYSRVLDNPKATLIVEGKAIHVRAAKADDASIDRASEAFRSKYPPGRSLDSMLRPEVLSTTLELEPAG